jgi:type VI protein secretion system component VasK
MSRWLGIGGLGLVISLVFLVWGVIAGIRLVTERLPQWLAGGKQIAAQSAQKADEVFPGLKERVEALVLGRKIEEWVLICG